MLSAGICLLVRRPWGWRIAAGAQLVAGGTQLVLASIGLSLANMARARGGDWVGFGVLAGQIVFFAALLPAILSVAGFFYLRRPRVKAAFYAVTHPGDEACAKEVTDLVFWIPSMLLTALRSASLSLLCRAVGPPAGDAIQKCSKVA